ncbi:MAG: DUF167 domain-containing protein [Patescibacteria group bacterium]|jgi:uncharacterized protein YggU (UPF0235/DUF167 family)
MLVRSVPQRIRVKAHARAKRRDLRPNADGSFDIWTTAAPDRDRANEDIIEILSGHLSVSKSAISLVSGRTANKKVFEVSYY